MLGNYEEILEIVKVYAYFIKVRWCPNTTETHQKMQGRQAGLAVVCGVDEHELRLRLLWIPYQRKLTGFTSLLIVDIRGT